jgi:hypothetical protein
MPREKKVERKYPLELILAAHGPAELVNADEETLWSSDADEDFKEEFSDEFLKEEDLPDICEYLLDNDYISQKEFNFFKTETWDCSVETIDQSGKDIMNGPDDEPDDDDDEGDED